MENPKRYADKIKRKDDTNESGHQIPAGSYNMMANLSIIKPLFQPHFKSIHSNSATVHPKLEVSQPDDASEVQAEELADSVIEGDTEQSQGILSESTSEVSRSGDGDAMQTTDAFDEQLQQTKGQGQKLDEETQSELEEHTGTDLSGVNIHTDAQAQEMSESINALAFASGKDLYFGEGNFNPQSEEGKRLLGHEVAHTVQEKNGLERKIMRNPVDPAKKKGYVELATPKELSAVDFTALRSDDKEKSEVEYWIHPKENFIARWESALWYYAECGLFSGYVLISEVAENRLMNEVVVTPFEYEGDLTEVADNIYKWYKKTQDHNWGDLSPGISEERTNLLDSIPETLSYRQRRELEQIMRDKYDVELFNILYIALSKEWGKNKDGRLFKALYRTTQNAHYETDNIKLQILDQTTIAVGASVKYAVKPKSLFYSAYNPPPRGKLILKDWVIWYPDGEVLTIRRNNDFHYGVKNPEMLEREFDLDQIGFYRIGAIVSDYDKVDMLLQFLDVRSGEELVEKEAAKIGEIPPGAFDAFRMQYVLQAGIAGTKMNHIDDAEANAASEIKQNSGANQFIVHSYDTAENFGFEYELKTTGNTKQIWYVIPYEQWVFPIKGNYNQTCYFEGDHPGAYEHDLPNGEKAYSNYKVLEPESRKKNTIPFPAWWKSDIYDLRFRVVAEEYNEQNVLVNAHQYVQYFRGAETAEYKSLKAIRDKANEQVSRIDKFSAMIAGEVKPLKAFYLNEETGNVLGINLFYGTDKKDPQKTRLVDLTVGAAKSDYIGDDLNDAINSYNYRQSYPDGKIYIYTDKSRFTITTTGGSLTERFTTWAGWVSTLAFVGGFLAMITGQEYLAFALFKVGLVAGAVTSMLSIYDQLDKDTIDPAMVAIEVLSIASTVLSRAAMGYRLSAQTTNSMRAAKTAQRLFAAAMLLDGSGVLILTGEGMAEINAVLADKTIDENERRRRVMEIISRLMINGVFFVFSNEEVITTRNQLQTKGVPTDQLTKLEKDQVSMLKVNRLTKQEIEQALRDGEDLVVKATMKEEMLFLAKQERAVRDVFVNHMLDKFNIKRAELQSVGTGVYDKPGRTFKSIEKQQDYHKELKFAEEICQKEKKRIVLAPEDEIAIDGFDFDTGKVNQLKELNSPNKLMTRINETYTKAKGGSYLDLELYVKTTETKALASSRYNSAIKQKSTLLANDGTINKIVVYCSDGEIQLTLPDK